LFRNEKEHQPKKKNPPFAMADNENNERESVDPKDMMSAFAYSLFSFAAFEPFLLDVAEAKVAVPRPELRIGAILLSLGNAGCDPRSNLTEEEEENLKGIHSELWGLCTQANRVPTTNLDKAAIDSDEDDSNNFSKQEDAMRARMNHVVENAEAWLSELNDEIQQRDGSK